MEYEAKREKIQNELNHQKEAEERRAQQQRAYRREGSSSSSSSRSSLSIAPRAIERARTMERDLELLDIQREQFYSGLMDSHSRQREQMEEYELALALSLSMAEANGSGGHGSSHHQTLPPSLSPSIMFPTSLVTPAYGLPIASRAAPRSSSFRSAAPPPPRFTTTLGSSRTGAQQWETDGMSYEDLCKLEDVKVTAPKRVVKSLETFEADKSFCSKGEMCSICQCGFECGEKVKRLKCGHTFHAECADEWLGKYSTNCPVCKERVG